MTVAEYKVALDALDDAGFAKFRRDFGGDFATRQQYVDDFVHHPDHERRLCQLLALTTEYDKRTVFELQAMELAKESNRIAQEKQAHLTAAQQVARSRGNGFVGRYRRLSISNKISLWGGVASIVSLGLYFYQRNEAAQQVAQVQGSPNSTINQPGRDLIITNAPLEQRPTPTLLPAQRRLLELVASYQKQFASSRLIVGRSDGRLHFDGDPNRASDISFVAELFGVASPHNAGRFEELVQGMPTDFLRVTSEARWDNPFVLSVTEAGMAQLARR